MDVKRSDLFDTLSDAEKELLGEPADSLTRALIKIRHEFARPDERVSAVNRELAVAVRRALPESEQLVQSLGDSARKRRAETVFVPTRKPIWQVRDWQLPPPPEIQGPSFRWVQTRVFGGHGIVVENQGPLAFVKGQAADLGDDRKIFGVGMESFFMIPTRALQTMSTETPQRWSHAPTVSILGVMSAFTSIGKFIFNWQDHWAKCRLHLRCEVLQAPTAGLPATTLSSGEDLHVIFDEENNLRWEFKLIEYENYLIVNSPSFMLAHDTENVLARVEIVFEVELEGQAEIRFRAPFVDQEQQATFTMAVREWAPWGWSRY